MKVDTDFPVDSNCFAHPLDAEGPVEDTCGNDAKTYVMLRKGVRRYICEDHAEEVDRFGETEEDHPVVTDCERCRKLTPVEHVDHNLICEECQI